jgi:4-hydroxybenzoate polyprenyltransferase
MRIQMQLLAASRRPERPLPRGLVTLRQLGALGIAAGVAQLALSAATGPQAIVALLVVWAYAMLMRVEFFAPRWLRAP